MSLVCSFQAQVQWYILFDHHSPSPRLVFKISVSLATLSIFHLLEIQKAGPAMQ